MAFSGTVNRTRHERSSGDRHSRRPDSHQRWSTRSRCFYARIRRGFETYERTDEHAGVRE
ncbi:MAG: hypothetical protein IJ150_05555 [Bacteroidales bacterium]|nr:hypothetical protein [Bacteroidales bacterium]